MADKYPPILVGVKYGRLTVVEYIERIREGGTWQHLWRCVCQCGQVRIVRASRLKNGGTTSCGCKRRESTVKRNTKHGESVRGRRTAEYIVWKSMNQRCYDPGNKKYSNYGGRGITVCDRWRSDYAAFLADMGRMPSRKHSIDRKNNDGNYEPDNCRWATKTEQGRNQRTNRLLTINGETRCVRDWEEVAGFPKGMIQTRLHLGWQVERLLQTPRKSPRRQDGR